MKQAKKKKNDDAVKNWRERASDRSLGLPLNKNTANHAFICEVKTGRSSKYYPDLTKLGAIFTTTRLGVYRLLY